MISSPRFPPFPDLLSLIPDPYRTYLLSITIYLLHILQLSNSLPLRFTNSLRQNHNFIILNFVFGQFLIQSLEDLAFSGGQAF
jgi:hypothetical protein